MPQTTFTKKLVADIERYFTGLGTNPIVFSNELHLQMHLAQFLEREGYSLFYEYPVPADRLKGIYPWLDRYGKPQELYIDLVVYNKDKFVPVEIKYKTRKLNEDTVVFNHLEKGVDRLRDQLAQDYGRYFFWKDVRRLELVRNTYMAVKNGIAIFVTNDPAYTNHPNSSKVNYYAFHLEDGRQNISGRLDWGNSGSRAAKENPGFELDGKYNIQWNPIGLHNTPRNRTDFSYCLLVV